MNNEQITGAEVKVDLKRRDDRARKICYLRDNARGDKSALAMVDRLSLDWLGVPCERVEHPDDLPIEESRRRIAEVRSLTQEYASRGKRVPPHLLLEIRFRPHQTTDATPAPASNEQGLGAK